MTVPNSSNPVPPNPNPAPAYPYYRRESSLAVASLICGVASWFVLPFFGAIAAVITGHLGKKEIRESNGVLSGDGMATAGLVLGYVQLGLFALIVCCVLAFVFAVSAGITQSLTGPSALILNLI